MTAATTHRATIARRYLDARDSLDVDTLAACRHPDFEILWPQTGEGVPDHDADVRTRTTDHDGSADIGAPSTPLPVGRGSEGWQLTGHDEVWIGQAARTRADGEDYHVLTVLELQEDLVHRETNWVAPAFPAPESRADLSELDEWRPLGDVVEASVTEDIAATRRSAIEAYFRDLSEDPVAAHEAFLHSDAVEVMPQSSERIVGRDRMIEVLLNHPSFPAVDLRRALVVGDTGLAEVRMREGDEDFFGIGIIHFRGQKADTITEYWAPRLERPSWRSQWVEHDSDRYVGARRPAFLNP